MLEGTIIDVYSNNFTGVLSLTRHEIEVWLHVGGSTAHISVVRSAGQRERTPVHAIGWGVRFIADLLEGSGVADVAARRWLVVLVMRRFAVTSVLFAADHVTAAVVVVYFQR